MELWPSWVQEVTEEGNQGFKFIDTNCDYFLVAKNFQFEEEIDEIIEGGVVLGVKNMRVLEVPV